MNRRVWVAGLALAASAAVAELRLHPGEARAEGPRPAQDGAACRAVGRVELARKLVCAHERVEVRFVLDPSCGDGSDAEAIQHLRLVHDLPPGVVSVAGAEVCQTDPATPSHWSVELSNRADGRIEVGHAVMAERPGVFELGQAVVEITDRRGTVWRSKLVAATLVASACSSQPGARPQPLYLPFVASTGCPAQSRPLDLVVAVDRSASMAGGAAAAAVARATGFLDQLAAGVDRVAVIGFDARADLVVPLTTDPAAVRAGLDRLDHGQGTRIERALAAAGAVFDADGPAAGRRRAVLVLTDGVQIGPGGDAVVIEAAAALQRRGVTVVGVGVGPAPNLTLLRAISNGPLGPTAGGDGATRLDDALHDAVSTVRCGR